MVDSSGQVLTNAGATQVFAYDAFGNLLAGTGLSTAANALTTLLYSGEQTDRTTGLQYLRARYYNPAAGRFTTLDPFAGDQEAPNSLHKYLYGEGDSINHIDPLGTFSILGISLSNALSTSFRATVSAYSLGFKTYALRTAGSILFSASIQIYAEHYLPPLSRELNSLASDLIGLAPQGAIDLVNEAADYVDYTRTSITIGNITRVATAFVLAPFPKLRWTVTGVSVAYGLYEAHQFFSAVDAQLDAISKAATDLGFPLRMRLNYTDPGGLAAR